MGKVVLSAAIMDLCHRGHLNLLKEMRKEAGDGAVVMVLHDDKSCYDIKGKFPIQHLEHRASNVFSTGLVDDVVYTFSTDPGEVFQKVIDILKADNSFLFMRGDDNKKFPGKHVIVENKIPIKYIPYTDGVSSTLIREELV